MALPEYGNMTIECVLSLLHIHRLEGVRNTLLHDEEIKLHQEQKERTYESRLSERTVLAVRL